MKKIFGLILMAGVMLLGVSCDPGNEGDDKNKGETKCYEFALNVQKNGFKAGKNGVTIDVTSIETDNIVFELKPGESVKSYRMEVYPKSLLYNELLNRDLVGAPLSECEDAIADLLSSATSGTSVNLFNAAEFDDFAAKEFDWANSTYNTATILSDCDYMIIVLPFYDEEGQVPAPLCICEVATAMADLEGNPYVGVEAQVGHTAFIVRYYPNEDCRYFYHWIWSTEEIGEYIDLFGERMMRDFCRVAGGPYDASVEDNLAFKRITDMPNNTAVVVAADANMVPTGLVRYDFRLLPKPTSDEFKPEVAIEAGSRRSATMTYITVKMEKSCESCFYRVYKKEEADALKNGTDAEKVAEAQSLAVEGWGVANQKFDYNSDFQQLTGSAYTTEDETKLDLMPETEYVIVYVGKNRFNELSELKFSEPFTTKRLVTDNPGSCVADVELTFTEVSRWGVRYNFSYTFSNTMCYRFQIVYPFEMDDPSTDEDDSYVRPPHKADGTLDRENREAWITYFMSYVEGPAGARPVANLWTAERMGYDSLADYGYESGTEYVIAYCAEDINGVLGPVQFASFTTTKPNPGPNPTIQFDGLAYDPSQNVVSGRVVANADAKTIRYFVIDPNSGDIYGSCWLPYLTIEGGRYTYENYLSQWKLLLVESGLSTAAESATISQRVDPNSEDPILFAAVAIGEKDGADVYSSVISKIFYKGELKDLSDFRTPKQ